MIEINRIGWENEPSTKTPKSAQNFRKMEENTETLVNQVLELVYPNILYSDTGSNGTITLSSSVVNFIRLKIYYRDNDNNYSSVEVINPDEKNIHLSAGYTNSTVGNIKSKTVRVSGTTISNLFENGFQLNTDMTSLPSNEIYITRVEGYKM